MTDVLTKEQIEFWRAMIIRTEGKAVEESMSDDDINIRRNQLQAVLDEIEEQYVSEDERGVEASGEESGDAGEDSEDSPSTDSQESP